MAIVFPASPSVNDTFTEGSITYKWDGAKWIGLGVTPADRLVEGSNSLEINDSNNLVWTGGNLLVGMDTVYNLNATAQIRNGINIVAQDFNGDVTQVSLAGEPVGRILFGDTRPGTYGEINCIADGVCGTNDYPGRLVFRTTSDGSGNTAERMRITSGGEVQIANGNLKFSTAGTGIDFSANANAAGMSSKVLDDYEEGSWTPTLVFGSGATGMVYGMREGHYTKIGRQVIAQFRIELTNKGSSTGGMTITTPFAVDDQFSSTGIDGNTLVAYTSGMSSSQVGNSHVSGYCEGGTSISYFTARLSTGNAATLNNGDVENNFSISGTMLFYNA